MLDGKPSDKAKETMGMETSDYHDRGSNSESLCSGER